MRQEIIRQARSWIGVRFRHQGRSRQGIDCVGLVYVVGKSLGLLSYDFRGYGRDTSIEVIAPHLQRAGMVQRPLKTDAQLGDVILLEDRAMPIHLAIFSASGMAIQASAMHRKVIEGVYDGAHAVKAVYSYPGV